MTIQERLEKLEKKHSGQRNEITRLLAIVNTQLELSKLWLDAVEGEKDYRRKALSNTALETSELFLEKAETENLK